MIAKDILIDPVVSILNLNVGVSRGVINHRREGISLRLHFFGYIFEIVVEMPCNFISLQIIGGDYYL